MNRCGTLVRLLSYHTSFTQDVGSCVSTPFLTWQQVIFPTNQSPPVFLKGVYLVRCSSTSTSMTSPLSPSLPIHSFMLMTPNVLNRFQMPMTAAIFNRTSTLCVCGAQLTTLHLMRARWFYYDSVPVNHH